MEDFTWERLKVSSVVALSVRIIQEHNRHIGEWLAAHKFAGLAVWHWRAVGREGGNVHTECFDGDFSWERRQAARSVHERAAQFGTTGHADLADWSECVS